MRPWILSSLLKFPALDIIFFTNFVNSPISMHQKFKKRTYAVRSLPLSTQLERSGAWASMNQLCPNTMRHCLF